MGKGYTGKERRKHPRKAVEIEIYYGHIEDFFYDLAINLSYGGTFIKTTRILPVGTRIKLEFSVPGHQHIIKTYGRVVRVVDKSDPQLHPPGMGIEFEKLSERDLEAISHLWEEEAKSEQKRKG